MPLTSLASDLLQRIPLSARTLLQVGAADEVLAGAYRTISPKARCLGVELNALAVMTAAWPADELARVDLASDELPFDMPDGIDCIIYNESLEYLQDPWALLQRHAEILHPDGMMLVCVPNAAYWRRTERLLRGTGHEAETERRRRQPLHWFSQECMGTQFANAGLVVCDVSTWEPDAANAAAFAAALAPGLDVLGVSSVEYGRRASASHLIWRVRKQPFERLIVSGSMLDPIGGVSHLRVVYPLRAIATDPVVEARVTDRVEDDPPSDGVARIFILHRPTLLGSEGQQTLSRLTNAGFLIVTEFDDLPSHFEMMRHGGALAFYGAHAVQTSTSAMAEALRGYNAEIAVFPNALAALPDVRNFSNTQVIKLFFGALNRQEDWLPFMPAINTVARMAGDRLKFEVVHDQCFYDALATPYKSFTPTCDYETYLRLLGGSEVSFMPLSDTAFNRAKSDLKFIEAGACRVAALASSVVYGDSIQDGQTGLLFRDPVELHARLLRLVTMPETARDLADAGRRYVAEERMLAYQVSVRIAWYRSLWARRASLTDARQERMLRLRTAS